MSDRYILCIPILQVFSGLLSYRLCIADAVVAISRIGSVTVVSVYLCGSTITLISDHTHVSLLNFPYNVPYVLCCLFPGTTVLQSVRLPIHNGCEWFSVSLIGLSVSFRV